MATTTVPTPFTTNCPNHSRTSHWFHPITWLFMGLIIGWVMVIYVWDNVRQAVRWLRFLATMPDLTSAQFDALADLITLQCNSEADQLLPFDEFDAGSTCTLSPIESDALRRCAMAKVPIHLIDRFAPRYSYSTVYPRPAS